MREYISEGYRNEGTTAKGHKVILNTDAHSFKGIFVRYLSEFLVEYNKIAD